MKLEDFFVKRLEERENAGILRELKLREYEVDFYSNDYLSLTSIIVKNSYEASPGSSRLIAGNTIFHEQLEQSLADFFSSQETLLFNSGYSANLGVLSAIPQKGDVILYDELSHASIKDGIRLSLAQGFKFKHNDLIDLNRLLIRFKDQRCFVVTEGLFSMDGVYGSIKEIDSLCKMHAAHLIVDEAHSGGTFGEEGKGICHELKVDPFVRVFTLGKAFGSHGAIVTCSSLCKKFLVNFSRSFIYTTALPLSVVKQTLDTLDKKVIHEQIKKLNANIAFFRDKFSEYDFVSNQKSPIQIYRPKEERLLNLIEKSCNDLNIGIKAIHPPSVPKGKGCLRICLHAANTTTEINKLHSVFSQQLS